MRTGDVVKLKSGGPYMTVTGVAADGTISVIWFNPNQVYNTYTFNEEVLIVVPCEPVLPTTNMVHGGVYGIGR